MCVQHEARSGANASRAAGGEGGVKRSAARRRARSAERAYRGRLPPAAQRAGSEPKMPRMCRSSGGGLRPSEGSEDSPCAPRCMRAQLALRAAQQQPRRAAVAARRAMHPSGAASAAASPVAPPPLSQARPACAPCSARPRRSSCAKHHPAQAAAPAECDGEDNAAAVRSALVAAGLTPDQIAAAAAREPRLFTFRRAFA